MWKVAWWSMAMIQRCAYAGCNRPDGEQPLLSDWGRQAMRGSGLELFFFFFLSIVKNQQTQAGAPSQAASCAVHATNIDIQEERQLERSQPKPPVASTDRPGATPSILESKPLCNNAPLAPDARHMPTSHSKQQPWTLNPDPRAEK